jgi:hypothetical protein
MKVFFVVLLWGKVAMWVGPLPYDMTQCEQYRLTKLEEVNAAFRANGNVIPPMGGVNRELRPENVTLKCELRNNPPEINKELDK